MAFRLWPLGLFAALGVVAAHTARAQPRVVTLGTATPGGGFPVYGQAVAETINAVDPSLRVETRNTRGSTENVPMLEAGQLDIALVQGEVAHEALSGIGRPPANLRIITAMYGTPGMFVARADTPYRTVADLKGKPVAFGARGSGLVVLARYVLDGLGLDRDRDFQAIFLDQAGDGPKMVMDGRVAALWGGGTGWPGFAAVASGPRGARGSGLVVLARYVLDGLGLDRDRDFQAIFLDQAGDGPKMVMDGRVAALWGGGTGWPGFAAVASGARGARFIAPDADGLRAIQAKHPFLKPMTVPAGSYPGQDAPIQSVGSWSFILAAPSLPDDVAYRLARALALGEADLARRLPQARETTAANTAAAARPDLIHPGVLRYLREIGLSR